MKEKEWRNLTLSNKKCFGFKIHFQENEKVSQRVGEFTKPISVKRLYLEYIKNTSNSIIRQAA